jgi:hypothetical protein
LQEFNRLGSVLPKGALRATSRKCNPSEEEVMIRTLKVLGLALAVCSLGAVYASGASAATDVFTCGNSTCFITGEQVGSPASNVLGVKGAGVETHCAHANFKSGTINSGGSDIVVTPEYLECTTAGNPSPVDVGAGCQLTLNGTTDAFINTNGVASGEDATAAVVNCGTNVIKITGSGCTISFGNQANLKGVKYDNETSTTPDDVLVTVTVDGITYTASGSLCDFLGFSTPGGNNAFLTETITTKAYEDVVGTPDHEGVQINLTVS